jgi:nitrite reductase/ring-hydroxylating ferredoxin subunit
VVELDGLTLAVFRAGDRVHVVEAACPHAGNPLVEGEILGTTLVCAFHGWRFDLETGACLLGDEPVRRFPAELRGGEVWIEVSAGD